MEHQTVRYAEPRRGNHQNIGLADGSTMRLYPDNDSDLVEAGQRLELWSLAPDRDCLFVATMEGRHIAAGVAELQESAQEWKAIAEQLQTAADQLMEKIEAAKPWWRRMFRRGRPTA